MANRETDLAAHRPVPTGTPWLALGALGVVYGDLGTNPLFALRESFHGTHGLALAPENVLGVVSLAVWALILVISVKYVLFVLRADNHGEGGTLALLAKIPPRLHRGAMTRPLGLVMVLILGSALLLGDGVVTPAISVLSRPWFTGQTELVLAPLAFLRRLAALIPPPRQNQTRYHGVFAANAKLRPAVTALVLGGPHPAVDAPHPHPLPRGEPSPVRLPARPPSRLPWSELLRRVFKEDLLVCPRCTGAMQVLATITDPAVVVAILAHLGAPTQGPAIAAARAPPPIHPGPGDFAPYAHLDAYDPP